LWVWPIIAGAILGIAGWSVNQAVEGAMREQRANDLSTILAADIAALRVWMNEQKNTAELVAKDDELYPLVRDLLALSNGTPAAERDLVQSKALANLRARLKDTLQSGGYSGFFLVAADGMVLAADQDPPIGKPISKYRRGFFDGVIEG